jgi:ketosteroid isomerase-like protein
MDNLQTIKDLYAAFYVGDVPKILAMMSPDVDWIQYCPEPIPFGGHYHGHDGIVQFFTKVGQNAEVEKYETREFQVAGNMVIVEGWQRVKARATGKVWETNFVHIYTFENGFVVKVREYYNTLPMAQAFTAA